MASSQSRAEIVGSSEVKPSQVISLLTETIFQVRHQGHGVAVHRPSRGGERKKARGRGRAGGGGRKIAVARTESGVDVINLGSARVQKGPEVSSEHAIIEERGKSKQRSQGRASPTSPTQSRRAPSPNNATPPRPALTRLTHPLPAQTYCRDSQVQY